MRVTRSLAWALACWGAGLGSAAGATVSVRVVDDAGGRTVAARVYLWRGDEPLLPPAFELANESELCDPPDTVLWIRKMSARLPGSPTRVTSK